VEVKPGDERRAGRGLFASRSHAVASAVTDVSRELDVRIAIQWVTLGEHTFGIAPPWI
jgi:hypothetical protein